LTIGETTSKVNRASLFHSPVGFRHARNLPIERAQRLRVPRQL
jgi:hypothetical protein